MEINDKLRCLLDNVITLYSYVDIDRENEEYIYGEVLKIHSRSFKVDIASSSYEGGNVAGYAKISILTPTMDWKNLFEIPYMQTNISIVNFPKGIPPHTKEQSLRIFQKDRDDLIAIGYALVSNIGGLISELGQYGMKK
jgi:hypothetical protein